MQTIGWCMLDALHKGGRLLRLQACAIGRAARTLCAVLTEHRCVKMAKSTCPIPTVSLVVTYAVAYTYACDDGRILPTRCAIIDAGLDGRCSPHQACRIPPAAGRSTRSALAGGSRPASAAAPDGFHRSRTRPRSTSTPCDDASPPRCVLDTRPCLLPPCLFESWLQCRRPP